MNIRNVLKKVDASLDKKEMMGLRAEIAAFLDLLKKNIIKSKIDADVFLGGSFAKETLAKSAEYDADIFVRFSWEYEDLSNELEAILKEVVKKFGLKMTRMHGSRDYFRIRKNEKLTFEIIPVTRIKKVQEARNVTDLSYFHVNYVRRNMNKNMKKQLVLAKKFFKANNLYGAESYIHGFSGYGLECLIIYYKSFERMIKELVKIKEGQRKIIDPAKVYKKKTDVFFELNESKLNGPIILIDPTWKGRNVLASLNWETFEEFQKIAKEFLKKPCERFFEKTEGGIDDLEKLAKKRKGEFLHLVLETNRQEGDIAGTKLKKFSKFLSKEIGKYFLVLDGKFFYAGEGNRADFYIVLKIRKEILKIGPPLERKRDVEKFKKMNKKTFIRNGVLHALVELSSSGKEFLKKWAASKEGRLKICAMSVTKLKIY